MATSLRSQDMNALGHCVESCATGEGHVVLELSNESWSYVVENLRLESGQDEKGWDGTGRVVETSRCRV